MCSSGEKTGTYCNSSFNLKSNNLIIMDKELTQKLINHYEMVIKKVNRWWVPFWWAFKICYSKRVLMGVCSTSINMFRKDIIGDPLIRKHCTYSYYWCKPVYQASSKEEMVVLLRQRVRILNKIKETLETNSSNEHCVST